MIILAVDPGTSFLGWGILSLHEHGGDATLKEYGVHSTAQCKDPMVQRQLHLSHCQRLIDTYNCEALVMEDYTSERTQQRGRVLHHYPFSTALVPPTPMGQYLRAANNPDMYKLVGALETVSVPCYPVLPLTWMRGITGITSGPIDKLRRAKDIQARLGTIREPRTKDSGNHATDACGVGLWWLDQWVSKQRRRRA